MKVMRVRPPFGDTEALKKSQQKVVPSLILRFAFFRWLKSNLLQNGGP
ncbi:hypothetical protein BH11VER1_BH11VER1_02420 [soil metagenome]